MPVESDADRAGFVSSDEFGVVAIWGHAGEAVPVNGILSTPTLSTRGVAEVEQIGVETCLRCRSGDLPRDAGQGDTVEVGERSYTVKSVLPTGDGFARAWLEPLT